MRWMGSGKGAFSIVVVSSYNEEPFSGSLVWRMLKQDNNINNSTTI